MDDADQAIVGDKDLGLSGLLVQRCIGAGRTLCRAKNDLGAGPDQIAYAALYPALEPSGRFKDHQPPNLLKGWPLSKTR